jgi:DNA primase catalytic core
VRINNLSEVVEQLKPYLRQYLEDNGTEFSSTHFTCPNKKMHHNDDKKPSAAFYPTDENYHCFVCNSSGDIFAAAGLLEGMPLEGREFIETVAELARRYDIKLDVEEDSVDVQNKKLRTMMELVRDAAYKTYLATPVVLEYVKNRGLSSIQDKIRFGYCNFYKLKTFLESKGYTSRDISDAGLSEMLLNERLLIPVYDVWGRISAFGSRRIVEDDSEKYRNSSTSELYKKSEILFNLHNAKTFETIIVVEGYMDALRLVSEGVNNVVALCGTALSSNHIQTLVKNKVKNLILCLDGDFAGQEATKKILESLIKEESIRTTILELKDDLDPDDFVVKFGVQEFLNQKCQTIFDFKLEKYLASGLDKDIKEDLLTYASGEKSFIEKEHMCKKIAKAAGVKAETVISEIERIERQKLGDYGVTTSDIVSERGSLNREVFLFEQWSQSRGELLGLRIAQYPFMTEKMDGIQSGMYIIAAEENTGKSALTASLMLNLALSNPKKVFVLYFGLDVSNRTLVARMVSNLSGLPINTVSNPKYKIAENPNVTDAQVQLQKRNEAIQAVRELGDSISVKDERSVRSIEDMERLIQVYQQMHETKQLVVIIDSLNQMSTTAKKDTRDIYMFISDKIKEWTVKFDIPVIAISELRKLQHPGMKPTNDDIKEVSDLKYDADVTILLYNEMHSLRDSEKVFVSDSGLVYPIVEGIVFKNKLSGFKGSFWWKFYTDLSRYEECTREEMQKYAQLGFTQRKR